MANISLNDTKNFDFVADDKIFVTKLQQLLGFNAEFVTLHTRRQPSGEQLIHSISVEGKKTIESLESSNSKRAERILDMRAKLAQYLKQPPDSLLVKETPDHVYVPRSISGEQLIQLRNGLTLDGDDMPASISRTR